MEVKLYKPSSRLLAEYIECFYTLKRKAEEYDVTYLAFPSIYPTIVLNSYATHKNTSLNNYVISHSSNDRLAASLVCQFEKFGWIKYQGAADEIVIYFKPLGINAFLEKPLRHYVQSFLVDFNPFDDYQAKMIDLFTFDNDTDKIQALEEYWLSKHKGFQHPFLQNIVEELMNDDESPSISALARKSGVSRTTLIKQFDLQLCTTPSQFRKVVRFRKAMKRYNQRSAQDFLVDISHAAEYFDQSHMVKDFKSLTNYSPKTFFSKLSTSQDGYINWLYL